MRKRFGFININLIFILLVFINSCKSDDNTFCVDVSAINIELQIHRFDQALFSVSPDSIPGKIPALEKDFGEFFGLFCSRVINIGDGSNRDFPALLQKYTSDFNIREFYNDCNLQYSDFSSIANDLTSGFKHYRYYFPEKEIPEIYLYAGGFNQSVIIAENILGIGLDKYMGAGYHFYKRLNLPDYQKYRMRREYIAPDCFRAIAFSEFLFEPETDNLISNMLYHGKIQYLLSAVLPQLHDTVKFGFTKKQYDWCISNERKIWDFLIDKKLLFSTDFLEIKRYTEDGPFTSSLSRESPARTGNWIGWKIICNYLKNNPEITLPQLMNENDFIKILNNSKYNPK